MPYKAQTELQLQFGEWASCYLQENPHCTFIPHHFFRASTEWQYSLSSPCWFTAFSMHLPALTGLPWIRHCSFLQREQSTGTSSAAGSALVSRGTFLLQITVQCSQPASHELASVPTAVQNTIYLRSSVLPDYSPTTTHWSVLKVSLGIGLFWHPGHNIPQNGRELDWTMQLWLYPCWNFASEFFLLLWFLRSCSSKAAPFSAVLAGCSLCHLPFHIYTWFNITLRRDQSLSRSRLSLSALLQTCVTGSEQSAV